MASHASLIVLLLATCIQSILAGCYFPLEFQGEFLTQSMTTREIAYSSVSLLFDSIPSWGNCHRRLGHHFILSQGGDEETGPSCFKCLQIVSRSPNVLQIHTNGLDQCHATEEAAKRSCPTHQQIRERRASEMMMYKTRGFYGGSAITKTYCPLNGRFKFTYSINDGTEDDLECQEPLSEASDCPTGYKFDLNFKGCSFPDFDMSFQCLASWPGERGETYMSLLDTKLPQLGEEPRPRYRCAIFKEDPDTGITHVALSSDSTCVHHLYSAQDGYETLHLEKYDEELQSLEENEDGSTERTTAVSVSHPECIFPDWMQGKWEGLSVSGGEMVFRDEAHFNTYRGRCVINADHPDRFVVDLKTDCGERSNYCALFQQRDVNVMEFQLGVSNSDHPDLSLCDVDNFSPSKWLTFGRNSIEEPPHCPLVGEYSGVLPDADGLCARSYADCNNPEVMFYTVFNCHNQSEVYEEREYRCFGQWEEDGLVYTYTERKDIPGNECFVGVTIDEERNIVTEAGQNCERGHQPERYGMTLHRQGKCSHEKGSDSSSPAEKTVEQEEEEEEERMMTVITERPVSPRLSTVQSVTVKVIEQKRRKHLHKHRGGGSHPTTTVSYQDILTNEIPGSASPSSSSSATRTLNSSVIAIVVTLITLLL